jgi:opacity protein-like surface antigen
MQFGNWVAGVEGDFEYTGSSKVIIDNPVGTPINDTVMVDWMSHLLVRGGYDFDGWLPYVTGGLVFANVSAKHTGLIAPNVTQTWSARNIRTGYSFGVGVEKQLAGGWSVRAEYLYDYWGSKDYEWVPGVRHSNIALTIDTVRFAFSKRF